MTDRLRFLCHLALWLAVLIGLLYVTGAVWQRRTAWRQVQDPHRRLLWSPDCEGSTVVLLGDSVFTSPFCDSPRATLDALLAARTGEGVYMGALAGAKLGDFQDMARIIGRDRPAGTVVFISLIPTRFLKRRAGTEVAEAYAGAFDYLVPAQGADLASRVQARLVFPVASRLALLRNREGFRTWLLKRIAPRRADPDAASYRNRTWDRDGDFARYSYGVWEDTVDRSWPEPDLEPVHRIARILGAARLLPVFVLTPINKPLVRAYAKAIPAGQAIAQFDRAHALVLADLKRAGLGCLDLYEALAPSGFSDLVHFNEEGHRRLADLFAARLRQIRAHSGG